MDKSRCLLNFCFTLSMYSKFFVKILSFKSRSESILNMKQEYGLSKSESHSVVSPRPEYWNG